MLEVLSNSSSFTLYVAEKEEKSIREIRILQPHEILLDLKNEWETNNKNYILCVRDENVVNIFFSFFFFKTYLFFFFFSARKAKNNYCI